MSSTPHRAGPSIARPGLRSAAPHAAPRSSASSARRGDRTAGSGRSRVPLALAAVGAVLLGGLLMRGGGERDGGAITVVSGRAAVLAAIDDLDLPHAAKAPLLAQAERDELEVWTFHVHAGRGGVDETYTVATDRQAHTYTVTGGEQQFSLPVTKSAPGFTFVANADNAAPGMLSRWGTPLGWFDLPMQAGQQTVVPVR